MNKICMNCHNCFRKELWDNLIRGITLVCIWLSILSDYLSHFAILDSFVSFPTITLHRHRHLLHQYHLLRCHLNHHHPPPLSYVASVSTIVPSSIANVIVFTSSALLHRRLLRHCRHHYFDPPKLISVC